jgi:hypothetical protein
MMGDQSRGGIEREPVFAVTFDCQNCGNEWDEKFPPLTTVVSDGKAGLAQVHNDECETLGTTGCDCCNTIVCPVCRRRSDVTLAGRRPLDEAGESA